MSRYLVIESRDPFECNDVHYCYDLVGNLIHDGHEVTLFLVQNGVLPARFGARPNGLEDLAKAGVEILADEFSLHERAMSDDQLVGGVRPSSLDVVIDRMAEGWKTLWH